MKFRHSIELAGLGCGFRSTMRYVKLILCSVVSLLVFTACSSSPNSSTSASSAPDSAPAETSTSEVDDVLDYPWPDSEALDWIKPVYEKSKQFRGHPVEYPPIEPSEDNPHGYSVGQPNICNEEIQRRFEAIGATYDPFFTLSGAEWTNCAMTIGNPDDIARNLSMFHYAPVFDLRDHADQLIAVDALRSELFELRDHTCIVLDDTADEKPDFYFISWLSDPLFSSFSIEDRCQFTRIVRAIFNNVHGNER